MPGSSARIECIAPGRYSVQIGAADIGTGTWTALTQISADALGVGMDAVDLQIGDTDLPAASVEGASSGLSSWGLAVCTAVDAFRREHGERPESGRSPSPKRPRGPTPRTTR